jgi:hypothetical protein
MLADARTRASTETCQSKWMKTTALALPALRTEFLGAFKVLFIVMIPKRIDSNKSVFQNGQIVNGCVLLAFPKKYS